MEGRRARVKAAKKAAKEAKRKAIEMAPPEDGFKKPKEEPLEEGVGSKKKVKTGKFMALFREI